MRKSVGIIIFKIMFGVIVIVLMCFCTKIMVLHQYITSKSIPIGLHELISIHMVKNTGIGFSIMANGSSHFVYALPILAIIVIALLRSLNALTTMPAVFLIGGGLSNLLERLQNGHVLDYFKLRIIDFPVFNAADTFITIGALLVLTNMLVLRK